MISSKLFDKITWNKTYNRTGNPNANVEFWTILLWQTNNRTGYLVKLC